MTSNNVRVLSIHTKEHMAGVRQFDEDKVFDRALALFWEKGYADTTMQDLAAATGVQRGSLYNAYQDKETLFLRVFERYRENFLAQARAALMRSGLRAGLSAFFELIIVSLRTGNPGRSCLSSKTALSNEVFHEPIRQALRGVVDGLYGLLRERLSREDELGADELVLSGEQAAEVLLTYTRGLVVMERVYGDAGRLRAGVEALLGAVLRPRG